MTSLLLMESISRIQHTSKWEQSQTKSFFALNPFLPLFFLMKPVGSCLSDPSPFTCWLFHCHYVWINDVFGNQKTDPTGCNVTVWKCSSVLQPAHFFVTDIKISIEQSMLLLSPHTQHTIINIYINLVNRQSRSLNMGSSNAEEWGGNCCCLNSDSAADSGIPAWHCTIPSRIRQDTFLEGELS